MILKWFIIINPTSGNGKSKKCIPKLLELLKEYNIPFNSVETQYEKHEIELVQNAISEGYLKFISVGGDGTLHNIVNGIMSQSTVKTSDIKVAVIPVGTGNDWVKTYGITTKIKENLSIIKNEKTTLQDIGKINLLNSKSVVYFNNLAGIGFDGHTVNSINKYKKLGKISYLVGGLDGFTTYKPIKTTLYFNNKEITTKSLMTLIGLCKYSGGGMRMTKDVNPADGLFDITIIKIYGIGSILLNLPKLYSGKIVNHKKVETYKTYKIKVTIPKGIKPFIQADGEIIPTSDFEVEIVPKAILFVIP